MKPTSRQKVRRRRPLGPLEMAVLDRLWEYDALDVTAMQVLVGETRGLARNTIQSTLERLVRKSLALRTRVGRAYEYRAAITREEWTTDAIREVFDSVPGADQALMLASFVDLVERLDAAALDSLDSLVRRVRESRTEDP